MRTIFSIHFKHYYYIDSELCRQFQRALALIIQKICIIISFKNKNKYLKLKIKGAKKRKNLTIYICIFNRSHELCTKYNNFKDFCDKTYIIKWMRNIYYAFT